MPKILLIIALLSLLPACGPGTPTPGSSPEPSSSSSASAAPSSSPSVMPNTSCATSSHFDAGDEGWRIVGDAENASGLPEYQPTGGNPGGQLSAKDDAIGGVWYWAAPASYLGNQAEAYGGTLRFQLKQSSTDQQFDDRDLILEGAGKKLVLDLPNNPGTDWTSYTVSLREGSFKLETLEGQLASADDLRSVLADLKALWIRGEFVDGADTGALDNVSLQKNCSGQTVISTFEVSHDDWKVAGDAEDGSGDPQHLLSGGNPGGYLSANDDVTGGVWYWAAPEKFLGNKSSSYQKTLSFDLKQSSTESQFEAADLILEGAGKKLVQALPTHPATDWTSYSINLKEGAWKLDAPEGQSASAEDLRSVLAELSLLWIRGEYIEGADTGGLDNVRLEG